MARKRTKPGATKSSHPVRNRLLGLLGLVVAAVSAVVFVGKMKTNETPGQHTPEGDQAGTGDAANAVPTDGQ